MTVKNNLNHWYTNTRNEINSNENKITVALNKSKGYHLLISKLKSNKNVFGNLHIASVITILISIFMNCQPIIRAINGNEIMIVIVLSYFGKQPYLTTLNKNWNERELHQQKYIHEGTWLYYRKTQIYLVNLCRLQED